MSDNLIYKLWFILTDNSPQTIVPVLYLFTDADYIANMSVCNTDSGQSKHLVS